MLMQRVERSSGGTVKIASSHLLGEAEEKHEKSQRGQPVSDPKFQDGNEFDI